MEFPKKYELSDFNLKVSINPEEVAGIIRGAVGNFYLKDYSPPDNSDTKVILLARRIGILLNTTFFCNVILQKTDYGTNVRFMFIYYLFIIPETVYSRTFYHNSVKPITNALKAYIIE